MKNKNLLNKFCGESRPTITNDNGSIFEVHNIGNGYEIISVMPYIYTRAEEYDHEGFECGMFLLDITPIFESKIQAVRYMIENAKYLL